MADQKSRSAFIPLLIVGVVLIIALGALTVIPLKDCPDCSPEPLIKWFDKWRDACPRCNDRMEVPLLNLWRREAEEGF